MIQFIVGIGLGGGFVLAFLLYLLFFPDKFEKLVALFWKFCLYIGVTAVFIQKRYTKHTIQSQINNFIRKDLYRIPGLEATEVKVMWVGKRSNRDAFLKDKKVVVHINREIPHAENIANAVFMFVSTSLLAPAKRYLSKSQATATDLFVTRQMISNESQETVSYFIDNHLHPKLGDGKRSAEFFESFERMDNSGIFYPVFLREIKIIGEQVFGGRKKSAIVEEVTNLIKFLDTFSKRKVGDESVPLQFIGSFCRVSIVIAGKRQVIRARTGPYCRYIRMLCNKHKIETIYLIGDAAYTTQIEEIYEEVSGDLNCVYTETFSRELVKGDTTKQVQSFLAVLRARKIILVKR